MASSGDSADHRARVERLGEGGEEALQAGKARGDECHGVDWYCSLHRLLLGVSISHPCRIPL